MQPWLKQRLPATELNKATLISAFVRLLAARDIAFQEQGCIEVGLSLNSKNDVDFADCIHLAIKFTHNQAPLTTLDREAAKLYGVVLLS